MTCAIKFLVDNANHLGAELGESVASNAHDSIIKPASKAWAGLPPWLDDT